MQDSQILSAFQDLPAAPPPAASVLVFDACNVGVVLRAVLFVEATMAVAALFASGGWLDWATRTGILSGAAMPATLAWLLVGCSAKRLLARLPVALQQLCGVLLGALAGLYGCAMLALFGLAQVPWLASALAGALLGSMDHEHERAAGAWHAEWAPLMDLLVATGAAASWLRECLSGLEVDQERMRENLDATGGLLLAERVSTELGRTLGRGVAHEAIERAAQEAGGEYRAEVDSTAREGHGQQPVRARTRPAPWPTTTTTTATSARRWRAARSGPPACWSPPVRSKPCRPSPSPTTTT